MLERKCVECEGDIPSHKRSDAKYCSDTCRAAAEKRRHRERSGTSTGKRRGPYAVARKEYETKKEALRERSKLRYHLAQYGKPLTKVTQMTKDRYRHARALGYRSGLEVSVARYMEERGIEFGYEAVTLPYVKPARNSRYSPDYVLPNGIIIETKGRFEVADRQKMALVKEQHPDLDIRFVFTNPNARISKTSKTSYGKWCRHHGFPFAKGLPPEEWLHEPVNEDSVRALEEIINNG